MPSTADLRPRACKGVTCTLLELTLTVETAVDLMTISSKLYANTVSTCIGVGELEVDLKGAITIDFNEFGDSVLLVSFLAVGILW
jgi:hypothetical protein